ncbi:MAG TPA: site-2 protease family protein [Pyrinomonadaceae bacterium]|jgi:Zn-dependent protease|nr:site-2 protease family protein [Pyrinomonadaceae bacterium]
MTLKDFFKRQILVARVFGIPVRIDYRWFVVFAMSVALIAANVRKHPLQLGRLWLPPMGDFTAWTLGIVTTLALFLSVFGHELSHALMGRTEGIEIDEIVLHPFGGLARLRTQPESPRAEFRIAVAGPAASFIFSLIAFGGMWIAARLGINFALALFFFVGAGNLLLAVFNLFPGYPLDGGRVLRAIVWKRSGNIRDATRIAGYCGQLMALVLIAFGIYMIVAPTFRAYFMGLWSVMVGVFLLSAATNVVKSAREPATVRDAMSVPVALEPELPINRFIDEVLPLHRHETFPVAHQGRLLGILSLEDLKELPREQWRARKARDVMRPVNSSTFLKASATMASARELMQRNGLGAVAVIDELGNLIGFLRKSKSQPALQK